MVFVSPTCEHCRSLMTVIEQSGIGDSYRFVNVNKAKSLPPFVDRVPLMFDGRDVHTDKELFDIFRRPRPGASARMAQPQVAPSVALGGNFSSSFSALDGGYDDVSGGNLWMVDAEHESIETPDSEPLPKKE